MTGTLLLICIAIAAGIAVAVQGHFMAMITRTAGTATSVFITYGAGAVVAAILWLTRRNPAGSLRDIPWYAWSAGLLGLVIVGGIGYTAPRFGLSRTIVITIAAQLAAAMLIDRSFDVTRGIGLAMTIGGAWLIVKG
ncbi:MAG TPA: DMT family transporter [Thermoanaerobaculia bacterium]|jgi:transporter family-2 protein|nr:DMT family transporter [Thermoanaerobaculia bacterium]